MITGSVTHAAKKSSAAQARNPATASGEVRLSVVSVSLVDKYHPAQPSRIVATGKPIRRWMSLRIPFQVIRVFSQTRFRTMTDGPRPSPPTAAMKASSTLSFPVTSQRPSGVSSMVSLPSTMIPIRVHSFSTRCISVRREHDCGPSGSGLLQEVPYQSRRNRVHTFEGLVEEQHRGLVDDGRTQCDLLAHATRVVADQL